MKAVQAALAAADGDALAEALERDGRIVLDIEGETGRAQRRRTSRSA